MLNPNTVQCDPNAVKTRPNVAHLQAFGFDAYMEIPIVHTDGKLSVQSKKLRLIGYHGAGAYRLLDLEPGNERSPEDFGEAWGSENDLAPPPAPPLPLPVAPATSERIPTPPVIVPGPLVAAPTSNAPLFTVGIAACDTPLDIGVGSFFSDRSSSSSPSISS
ncbi:hypothetical protein B0H14DRAFT_3495821 [Mycena olivaceomarginata]|nr:hypothetical protein B0H14DRAFT_3495821 [Mycena olivaceomarginata]